MFVVLENGTPSGGLKSQLFGREIRERAFWGLVSFFKAIYLISQKKGNGFDGECNCTLSFYLLTCSKTVPFLAFKSEWFRFEKTLKEEYGHFSNQKASVFFNLQL